MTEDLMIFWCLKSRRFLRFLVWCSVLTKSNSVYCAQNRFLEASIIIEDIKDLLDSTSTPAEVSPNSEIHEILSKSELLEKQECNSRILGHLANYDNLNADKPTCIIDQKDQLIGSVDAVSCIEEKTVQEPIKLDSDAKIHPNTNHSYENEEAYTINKNSAIIPQIETSEITQNINGESKKLTEPLENIFRTKTGFDESDFFDEIEKISETYDTKRHDNEFVEICEPNQLLINNSLGNISQTIDIEEVIDNINHTEAPEDGIYYAELVFIHHEYEKYEDGELISDEKHTQISESKNLSSQNLTDDSSKNDEEEVDLYFEESSEEIHLYDDNRPILTPFDEYSSEIFENSDEYIKSNHRDNHNDRCEQGSTEYTSDESNELLEISKDDLKHSDFIRITSNRNGSICQVFECNLSEESFKNSEEDPMKKYDLKYTNERLLCLFEDSNPAEESSMIELDSQGQDLEKTMISNDHQKGFKANEVRIKEIDKEIPKDSHSKEAIVQQETQSETTVEESSELDTFPENFSRKESLLCEKIVDSETLIEEERKRCDNSVIQVEYINTFQNILSISIEEYETALILETEKFERETVVENQELSDNILKIRKCYSEKEEAIEIRLKETIRQYDVIFDVLNKQIDKILYQINGFSQEKESSDSNIEELKSSTTIDFKNEKIVLETHTCLLVQNSHKKDSVWDDSVELNNFSPLEKMDFQESEINPEIHTTRTDILKRNTNDSEKQHKESDKYCFLEKNELKKKLKDLNLILQMQTKQKIDDLSKIKNDLSRLTNERNSNLCKLETEYKHKMKTSLESFLQIRKILEDEKYALWKQMN